MECVEKLLKMAQEELRGAKKYIDKAMHNKIEGNKYLADKFYTLADAECKHADELKTIAEHEASEYKLKHGELSEHDRAVIEVREEDIIDGINELKREFLLYKS